MMVKLLFTSEHSQRRVKPSLKLRLRGMKKWLDGECWLFVVQPQRLTVATGVIPVVAKQNENETIGSGQITSFCRKKFNTQSS